MRDKIHFYLNDTKNKIAIGIDIFIYSIIFLTVIDHSLQTMPSMAKYHDILERWEIVPIVIFSLEYFLRIYSSRKRLGFIFSFWGLVDLLAIIPYYLGCLKLTKSLYYKKTIIGL